MGWLSLLAAILGLILIAAIREAESRAWCRSLIAYRIRYPAGLKPDTVATWLTTLAAQTRSSRTALLPFPPLVLETDASKNGINHYILVPRRLRSMVLASVRATLPGARLEETPDYRRNDPAFGAAANLDVSTTDRAIAAKRAKLTSTAVLSMLQPLYGHERVRLSWIISGARTPNPDRAYAHQAGSLLGALVTGRGSVHGSSTGRSTEATAALRAKYSSPMLRAVARVGVVASQASRRQAILNRIIGALRTAETPGLTVKRRSGVGFGLGIRDASGRLHRLSLPWLRWPFLLNVDEAAGLVGIPLGNIVLPGLALGSSRQLPPSPGMPRGGTGTTVVAESNYPGMRQSLALLPDDRLQHSWIIGPTGTGKSTLLANLILQDLNAGRGLVAIDPKGDLITDVLARVPDSRVPDVVVLDLAATDFPVGFNLLRHSGSMHSRELAVDHVVHVMASLWHSSWGPRTSDVLRSCLLTLTHATAPDGSAFTLAEVPELLTNPAFRRYVLAQPSVPASVRPFWNEYEQRSDAERLQIIGPSLNKLRALNTRTALRLALGQSQGFDLGEIFWRRKALLVSLAKGTLGTETAQLSGALLVASLWQQILQRVTVPAGRRHPVFVYLDEFQDVVRLPLDLGDMLAQARGLGAGLVLAYQYLDQLPDVVKTAVLGTARTQIAFQLNSYDDARVLARPFAPMTPDDLMGMEAYEIAMRPAVHGRTLGVVTGRTAPLPDAIRDGAALAAASRQRYGVAREKIDAAMAARTAVTDPLSGGVQFGREYQGGRS